MPLGHGGLWGPHQTWAELCHPLSPSQIPAGAGSSCWWLQSPRGGNGTQQDPGVPASKAARALLLKAPSHPTPCSPHPAKSSQEITSVHGGKLGCWGRWNGVILGHRDGTGRSLAPCSRAPTVPCTLQLRQLFTHPQGEEKEDWKETQTRQVRWTAGLIGDSGACWGQQG